MFLSRDRTLTPRTDDGLRERTVRRRGGSHQRRPVSGRAGCVAGYPELIDPDNPGDPRGYRGALEKIAKEAEEPDAAECGKFYRAAEDALPDEVRALPPGNAVLWKEGFVYYLAGPINAGRKQRQKMYRPGLAAAGTA